MAERQTNYEVHQNFLFTDIQDLLNLPTSDLIPFTESIEQSELQTAISTITTDSLQLSTNVYNWDYAKPSARHYTQDRQEEERVDDAPTVHDYMNTAITSTSEHISTRYKSVIVKNKQKEYKNVKPDETFADRVQDSTPICKVCGDKAGKHAYYGGIVCGSCRAFFRRSVQSKYYLIFQCKISETCEIKSDTKKKCQFCRFERCLAAGMNTSWVLSDEERNRRFNKLNKLNSGQKSNRSVSELYMKFTREEQHVLEGVCSRFYFNRITWLTKLFHLNREAGLNILEATFTIAPLKMPNRIILAQAFHLYFVTNIVPKLLENSNLPSKDIAQILNGENSEISHLFKITQFKTKERREENVLQLDLSFKKDVSDMMNNFREIENPNMVEMISNLPVKIGPTILSYEELYPDNWANNKEIEDRHRELVKKLQRWPTDEKNQFDYSLVWLMTIILLFNSDYNPLLTRSIVEPIQLKYVILLQRYLRYKMNPEMANKKFLEAMLVLSYTKELWEINNLHANVL